MIQTTTFEGYGGVRLTGDVAGDESDPTVLLLHGGGQTRHSWGTTQENLAGRGWHVVSLDLRGHGDSDWDPNGEYLLDSFARDVVAVASLFDRPALVGASLGGSSSLAATAIGGPDVARALVLVDVSPYIEPSGVARIGNFMRSHVDDGFGSLEEVADAIAEYNPHRPRPRNLEGLKKNLRLRDGRWYWHWDPRFMGGRAGTIDETRLLESSRVHRFDELIDAAKRLTIPTLLVRGRQSDLLSEEGARKFLELVPHAEFVDVAGAGHMVAGDRNDVFSNAVVGFLDRIR